MSYTYFDVTNNDRLCDFNSYINHMRDNEKKI